MWKPTMATRLLQSLLLILLAMSTVRGSVAAGGSPSWCVCRPDASHAALQSTLDYACGNGADCGPLLAGAKCHNPNTLLAHCSYAANSYFHKISRANEDATCDLGGAATLSEIDPSSETCTYPASTSDDGATASPPVASKAAAAWCVCQPGVSDARLQRTLDYACGHGADCDALRRGGQCHLPDTLLAHCSYAANSYFQSNKDAACDFAGTAALSSTDPSSRTCKYPATDNAMSPPVGNLTLWILLMGLMMALVLFIVLLCLACKCGSSTRARVADGAAVEVETGTAPAGEGDGRSITSTCSVCLEAWTNLGPHRICCIIRCGHVYGRSCLESWMRQRGNSRARCPQCGTSFQLNDIINLYGPEPSA